MRRKKMKLRVTKNGNELFFGNPIDIPLKEKYIIEKSIELFDDEDPCIIHKSYVVKGFVDELLTLFKESDNSPINGNDHQELLNNVDFTDTNSLIFTIEG